MINAINITKSYQQVKVLQGINLHVSNAELVSIVGTSGAGKSTLLHILGTLDNADSGQLMLDGVDIHKLSRAELSKFRNQQIGFIFQFHHLLPEFTALENVCLPGFIAKKNDENVKKRAKELLDFLGLSTRFHHKPNQLSGGEMQRVALARALVNSPKMIFADEPTGNLDQANAHEVISLLLQLRKEAGITMLIVTHDYSIAEKTDRILIMKDGLIDKIQQN